MSPDYSKVGIGEISHNQSVATEEPNEFVKLVTERRRNEF